ncbi:MAG: Glycosyltransferases involved in cell wall biogenesis [Phormidium sp. OSCR]|nr:MAG: Glycosyltransferases involved in cell wall biogenesis [Phormidium sp. OSCR]
MTPSPQPGIAVISCCMNRNDNLKQALSNWLQFPNIKEIIIVDWSSEIPVSQTLAHLTDPRLNIIRVEGEQHWILSYAFNLAASLTTEPTLLKLDADVLLHPNFFQQHPLPPNHYWAGNWQTAKAGCLSGVLYIHRHDFFAVNGYNEFIRTYGWDDMDLYQRLDRQPHLRRGDLDSHSTSVLEHSPTLSFSKQSLQVAHPDLKQHLTRHLLVKEREFQNRKNKYISEALPWGPHYQRANYQDHGPYLTRLKQQEPPIPDALLAQAETQALCDCLRFTYSVLPSFEPSSLSTQLNQYLHQILQTLQTTGQLPESINVSPEEEKQFYYHALQHSPHASYLYAALGQLFHQQNQPELELRANRYALQYNPTQEQLYHVLFKQLSPP